jgi:hypothetical protein
VILSISMVSGRNLKENRYYHPFSTFPHKGGRGFNGKKLILLDFTWIP